MQFNTPSQDLIDNLKKKYKTVDDLKKSPVWGSMNPDMQNAIIGFYGPLPQAPAPAAPNVPGAPNLGTPNAPTQPGTPVQPTQPIQPKSNEHQTQIVAPNNKVYTLFHGVDGVSFIGIDGTRKNFKDEAAAKAYIDQNNPTGVDATYNAAQNNVNQKYTAGAGINVVGRDPKTSNIQAPEDTTGWTEKDREDLERRQRIDSFEKSMISSFGNLSFSNAEFKKLVDENLKTQLLKNAQMQETLKQQKAAVDGEFKLVYDKFSENQKEALKRVDEMESKWMQNFEQIQEQNKKYYEAQNKALDAKLGGEQAGIASALAAKGINEGVIGNAMAQVTTQHQSQYNALLKNNIEISKGLNDSYLSFFKDVQSERGKWSDTELRLLEDKMRVAKDIIAASKDVSQNTITNAFKPYEDAAAAIVGANISEQSYAAQDQAAIARYATSGPEERKMLLIAKLGLKDADAYGTMSKFDLALLDAAVKAKDLPTAIQILGKAAKQAEASGGSLPAGSKLIPQINEVINNTPATPQEESKQKDIQLIAAGPSVKPDLPIGGLNLSYDNVSTTPIDKNVDKVVPSNVESNTTKEAVKLLGMNLYDELTKIQNNKMQPDADKAMAASKIYSNLKKERDLYIKAKKDGAGLVGKEYDIYKATIENYNKKLKELMSHPIVDVIRSRNTRR